MAKRLFAQGLGAGHNVPIHWQCEGCGWLKAAMPERPDPTKVPPDVQAEFDAHRCEQEPGVEFLAQIAKERYVSPKTHDAYFLATLRLSECSGRELSGSPRYFPEFKAVADLLQREANISYEELVKLHRGYEAGDAVQTLLMLTDSQIVAMGFRPIIDER